MSGKKISFYDLKGQASHIWHKLVHLDASPHSVALGLALGIFIGFLPIMGIQMAVVLLFSMPFKRANKVAAVSGVWVSNPLTVAPIYFFIYWVGILFYPQESVMSGVAFRQKFETILGMDSFISQTKAFFALGADIFVPMCIGGAIVGLIGGIATYFIARYFVKVYRCRIHGECEVKVPAPEPVLAEEHSDHHHPHHSWLENEDPVPGILEGHRHKKESGE